ncbi:MAG: aminomethyltransferase family protein [Mesorhizobium sp.]|nr:aminomethyltransferase family protein [Mesorhizobium sp.]
MLGNAAIKEYSFKTTVGVPPYAAGELKFRKGIKQTAFHGVIGSKGALLKVHNTFLKPFFIEDLIGEYWQMRKVAGLFDVTGEEIIEIAGPDALGFMNEMVTRDLRKAVDGQCLYGIMCYDYGGIVEDAVIVRFSAERFWWVGGLGYSEQWLYANSLGRNVTVRSLLDRKALASIQGPRSRDILQSVCGSDITGLPFYHSVETDVCGVPCVVTRTGYTAELGFEIIVDQEKGEGVFGGIWEKCAAAGGALCGSGVMDLRRVEAGLIDFSTDFDWHHTPHQVGLGWMLNMNKGFFHGRDALATQEARNPASKLAGLRLAGQQSPLKGDAVLVDGVSVGEVTSGIVSPTLQVPLAIALLAVKATGIGQKVEVASQGQKIPAEVVAMPFLDPERKLSKV